MAQPRESVFNPSSPRSSTGNADSYKNEGTPDTRLTAFSPEEGSARSSKYYSSLSLTASDPQPSRFPGKTVPNFRPSLDQADKDPFTTSQASVKREQRLSPLASDFQPYSIPFGTHLQPRTLTFDGNNASFGATRGSLPSPPGFTNGTGVDGTRYVVLASSVNRAVTASDANILFSHLENIGHRFKGKRCIQVHGTKVYVRFTDLRDASMLFASARDNGTDWRVDFVSLGLWQLVSPGSVTDYATEGRVLLVVDLGRECRIDADSMEVHLYHLLAPEAEIRTWVKQGSSSHVTIHILIEFFDVDGAAAVIQKYNGFAPEREGFTLHLFAHSHGAGSSLVGRASELPTSSVRRNSLSDITSAFQGLTVAKPSQFTGNLIASGRPGVGHLGMPVVPQAALYPQHLMYQSPSSSHYFVDPFSNHPSTPYHVPANLSVFAPVYQPTSPSSLVPYQADYHTPKPMGFVRPDARRQYAQRVNRSPYHNAAGSHNHVEVNRIREGIDVRTTIMLRNIPNKVDQAMLKRLIDESSWGKYDFMYLRIDFANDCNVGYAFINFVDPLDIIDFVEARGNQRWNCFKSDKIAEISYATIQGKDCLVQKFRNSSVMLEAEHYRPKLYYTTNGPHPELAGQEEAFPGPDNQSKMKRSCENAEHVGLFTPNAGQNLRDEQRRRRSQYDRGTRAAAMEEFDFENNYEQNYRGYGGQ